MDANALLPHSAKCKEHSAIMKAGEMEQHIRIST